MIRKRSLLSPRPWLWLGLWLCAVNAISAPSVFDLGQPFFKRIEPENKLPSQVITSLFQDDVGYLWIGTQRGLVRFDGYHSQNHLFNPNDPHAISGNNIRSIWQDSDQLIWIGTMSSGLSVYDPKTRRFTQLHTQEQSVQNGSSNRINVIFGFNDQVIVGSDDGLTYFKKQADASNPLGYEKIHLPQFQNEKIRALARTKDKLWVATSQGLTHLSINAQNHVEIDPPNLPDPILADSYILSLLLDSQNNLWVGTMHDGVHYFDTESIEGLGSPHIQSIANTTNSWIMSIIEAPNGHIWVGTYGDGILVYDAENQNQVTQIKHDYTIDNSLSANSIGRLYVDESGLIWVGTWGGGLDLYNPNNQAFKVLKHSPLQANSLTDPDIRAILPLDNGLIWAGTRNNGIDIIHPALGVVDGIREDTPGFKGQSIKTLASSGDGTVWIGTRYNGVYQYDLVTQTFQQFTLDDGLLEQDIRKLHFDDSGRLWVASNNHLHRFDQATARFTPLPNKNDPNQPLRLTTTHLASDAEGNLWFGSFNGLYVLPAHGGDYVYFSADGQAGSISGNNVSGLLFDSKNRLWLDTRKGLNLLESWDGVTARFRVVKAPSAESATYLGANMLEDDNNIIWTQWHNFNPNTSQIKKWSESDGVDIGTAWRGSFGETNDGIFMYGGTKGILMINPKMYSIWDYSPSIAITHLEVNGQTLNSHGLSELNLQPNDRDFSIDVAALDFSAPENNTYQYTLVGYDTKWHTIDAKHRNIRYTNLDPGEYQLIINGTNGKGMWSNNQLEIAITQHPAWYNSKAFKWVLGLLFTMGLFSLYHWRILRLKKRTAQLDFLVQQKTHNIMAVGEIGKELSQTISLKAVVKTIHTHLNTIVDTHRFAIGVLDETTQSIEFKHPIVNHQMTSDQSIALSDQSSPAVWCVNNNRQLIIQTEEQWSSLNNLGIIIEPGSNAKSIIYEPLANDQKLIGCLTVQSNHSHAFDPSKIAIIQIIANHASVALSNAMLFKKLDNALLEIRTAHRSIQDKNKQLIEAVEKIETVSLTDTLTDAYNRRYVKKNIETELDKISPIHNKGSFYPDHDLGFVLIDIDWFKSINDTHGHDAGDLILMQLSARFKQLCGHDDWLIRWGGEEFLIITRNTDRNALFSLAERIRTEVESKRFEIGNKKQIQCTCSLGVSAYPFFRDAPQFLTWEQTLNLADSALYMAKRSGRNASVYLFANDSVPAQTAYAEFIKNEKNCIENQSVQMIKSKHMNTVTWG